MVQGLKGQECWAQEVGGLALSEDIKQGRWLPVPRRGLEGRNLSLLAEILSVKQEVKSSMENEVNRGKEGHFLREEKT